jgi:copper chaperone CopZ
MKTILFALLAVFATSVNVATALAGKKEKITVQTSAQCGGCEARITKAVAEIDGVKKTTFDMATKQVTVTFDTDKTNADAIRKAIANVGYDADTQVADPSAYSKLPGCCQKGGHD